MLASQEVALAFGQDQGPLATHGYAAGREAAMAVFRKALAEGSSSKIGRFVFGGKPVEWFDPVRTI